MVSRARARPAGRARGWSGWGRSGRITIGGGRIIRGRLPVASRLDAVVEVREEVGTLGVEGGVDGFEEGDSDGVEKREPVACVAVARLDPSAAVQCGAGR